MGTWRQLSEVFGKSGIYRAFSGRKIPTTVVGNDLGWRGNAHLRVTILVSHEIEGHVALEAKCSILEVTVTEKCWSTATSYSEGTSQESLAFRDTSQTYKVQTHKVWRVCDGRGKFCLVSLRRCGYDIVISRLSFSSSCI